MSGIAIIIKGADFSQSNLGKVNFLENIAVESISILGQSVLSEKTAQYTISALPEGTSQTEVLWSITSGSEYAKIDENGKLTVIQTVESASVTIKAVSLYNSSVYAEKQITLSSVEIPPISPTYKFGFYAENGIFNNTDNGYNKYATFDGISLDSLDDKIINVICEDGWQVRLIAMVNSNTVGNTRGGSVTSITDIISETKKLNANAKYFALNVSHSDTTAPSNGTDITEEELQNMDNYIKFIYG